MGQTVVTHDWLTANVCLLNDTSILHFMCSIVEASVNVLFVPDKSLIFLQFKKQEITLFSSSHKPFIDIQQLMNAEYYDEAKLR